MINKIYLHDYIMSYEKIKNYLYVILKNKKYSDKIIKEECIGKTTFDYNIECFKIGNGRNHVILYGTTHGTEICTTYFLIEFILTLLNDEKLYNKYSKIYTFHIIPILNIEGYIISSSSICKNIENLNNTELQKLAKKYQDNYVLDDETAIKKFQIAKNYKNVLKSSTRYITDIKLRKSVENILKSCNLEENVLPIWSSNGMGIDLNKNSIHKFKEAKKYANKKKFAKLRYNDIPIIKPSPIGYVGGCPFDTRAPENLFLHKYINCLYNMNFNTCCKDRLIAIFSFHSTGGEIYGYPDSKFATNKKIQFYVDAMKRYAKYTNYNIINEERKFGIMDFYRACLKDVLALTIELSVSPANPIGPFADIDKFLQEVQLNKIAIFNTLNYIINNL